MKSLYLTLCLLLVSSALCLADTQRYVFFRPDSQAVTLYRADASGYSYTLPLSVSDLEAPQQATVAASLAWLQSQLDEDETLALVIFVPYRADEETLGLRASVTGIKANGAERTLPDPIDSKDVPDEVRAGLVGLWTDLAAIPAPSPTPRP